MNWNLEGKCIDGLYMETIPLSGRVELSRVKYGGGVSHHIRLFKPVVLFGEVREHAIIDHYNVTRVYSNP